MNRTPVLLTITLLAVACTPDKTGVESISFKADDFRFENASRSDLAPDGTFKWSQADTVGIFPDSGSQIYFALEAGSGASCATFDGGAWDLKPSTAYLSYYPFVGDIYLNKAAIPVSYQGQKQTANASAAHVSAYDFMYASGTVGADGKLLFNYHHLNALLRMELDVAPATYTNVNLTGDASLFVTAGHYDLAAGTPSIIADKTSSALKLALGNVAVAEGEKLILYAVIAPADFSGLTITATLTGKSVTARTFKFKPDKAFEAGHGYILTASN